MAGSISFGFTSQPASATVGAPLTDVVVQLQDNKGHAVLVGGVEVSLALSKGGGLTGRTNAITDVTGQVTFTDLIITQVGKGDTLQATGGGYKKGTSSSFNVAQGLTATEVSAAASVVKYGQPTIFISKVKVLAPASGLPTGTVTFKNGNTVLGTVALDSAQQASFTITNPLPLGKYDLTAIYSGNVDFTPSTNSVSQNISITPPAIGNIFITPPSFNGVVRASLEGTPGQTFVLQASTDLLNWTPISTNVADASGIISIVQSNTIAYPSRYFRGMMPLP